MSLSTKDSNILNHARHNKQACAYLSEHSDYSDWIITTAFYSALHFVDYKIFPLKFSIKGKEHNYSKFDDYYDFFAKKKSISGISRHKARLDLVEKRLSGIAPQYSKLLSLCTKARYVNYEFDNKWALTCSPKTDPFINIVKQLIRLSSIKFL
jgi:hypothetical protein